MRFCGRDQNWSAFLDFPVERVKKFLTEMPLSSVENREKSETGRPSIQRCRREIQLACGWKMPQSRDSTKVINTSSQASARAFIRPRPLLWNIAGPVRRNLQYTYNKTVDSSQCKSSNRASNSKLHSTIIANYIHTIESCEQPRNDLSGTLICFGHVLRRTKPLKAAIL
jgi:hypothetical protein